MAEDETNTGPEGEATGRLFDAARSGDADAIRLLLDAEPELAHAADRDGRTPLLVAAARGDAASVRALLAREAELGTCTAPGADAAYEAVVAHFGESGALDLRVLAAEALLQRGWSLILHGDYGRAAGVLAEPARRFGTAGELPLRLAIASALDNRAFALLEAGRPGEALSVLDELVGRFGAAPEADLREAAAVALECRAETLVSLGRPGEAADSHAEIARRFGADPEPALRRRATAAVLERCLLLAEAGDHGAAAAACAELLARFAASGRPEVWPWMAGAVGREGPFFDRIDPGREGLLRLCDRVVCRLGDNGHPLLRELVAGATLARARDLGRLGRHEEAAAACDELVERLGDAETLALRDAAARARELGRLQAADHRLRVAMNHRVLGDLAGAVASYDEVIAEFDPADGPALRLRGARALFGRGWCLDRLGDGAGAALAFGLVVRRYAGAGGPGVRKVVALARVFLALVLTEVGRKEEGEEARHAVARLGEGPQAVPLLAWIGEAFGGDGRYAEADLLTDDPGMLRDRIVRCFGPGDHPGLRALVAEARPSRPS